MASKGVNPPVQPRGSNSVYYSETHDENGKVRWPYKEGSASLSGQAGIEIDLLNPPQSEVDALTIGHPLRDRISIHPIPLLLSQDEGVQIQFGAQQRAFALARFFEDVVLKRVSPTEFGMPADLLDRILRPTIYRNLEFLRNLWNGQSPSRISFAHGPDIIRGMNGKWMVMEDNVGALGGLADTSAISNAFWSIRVDGTAPRLNAPNGNLRSALIQWQTIWSEVRSGLGDLPMLVLPTALKSETSGNRIKKLELDLESVREQFVLNALPNVSVRSTIFADITEPRVRTELFDAVRKVQEELRDNAKLRLQLATVLGGRHLHDFLGIRSIDDFETANRAIVLLECLITPGVLNLLPLDDDQFNKNEWQLLFSLFKLGVPFLQAPGTDELLGHKSLLPYMDQLIWRYIQKAPLLPTVPSAHFGVDGPLSSELTAQNAVLKRANSGQGRGVYILPRKSKAARERIWKIAMHQSLEGRQMWIAQEFVEPSRIGDYSIHLRPITFVLGHGFMQTYDAPWGGASNGVISKDRKSNISRGARELVVMSSPLCESLLTHGLYPLDQ